MDAALSTLRVTHLGHTQQHRWGLIVLARCAHDWLEQLAEQDERDDRSSRLEVEGRQRAVRGVVMSPRRSAPTFMTPAATPIVADPVAPGAVIRALFQLGRESPSWPRNARRSVD